MQTEKEKEKGQMVKPVSLSKAFLMDVCGIALHLVDFKLKYRVSGYPSTCKAGRNSAVQTSLINLGNSFTPLLKQCQVRKSNVTSGKIQGKPRQEAEGSPSLATANKGPCILRPITCEGQTV